MQVRSFSVGANRTDPCGPLGRRPLPSSPDSFAQPCAVHRVGAHCSHSLSAAYIRQQASLAPQAVSLSILPARAFGLARRLVLPHLLGAGARRVYPDQRDFRNRSGSRRVRSRAPSPSPRCAAAAPCECAPWVRRSRTGLSGRRRNVVPESVRTSRRSGDVGG